MNSVGTYPSDVWKEVWERNGSPVFRHYQGMLATLPVALKLMADNCKEILLRTEFFELRPCKSIGYDIKTVKPILQYIDEEVLLKYNIGTRTNGVDKPEWPQDLMTEILQ